MTQGGEVLPAFHSQVAPKESGVGGILWRSPGWGRLHQSCKTREPEAVSCLVFLRASVAETTWTSSSSAARGRARASLSGDDPRARDDSWEVDRAAATGATWARGGACELPRPAGGREVCPLGGRISFLAAGTTLPPPTRCESLNFTITSRGQVLKTGIGGAANKKTWAY